MANDLNQCNLIGRLGLDPEVRYTQDQRAITSISLAVGSQWKDKQTGEKRESTEWVRVVAFGKLAEIMSEYLKKGSQVFVSGQFKTRKWRDDAGTDRWTTEIVANTMQMLGGRPQGDGAAGGFHDAAPPNGSASVPDSYIPF